MSGTSAQHDELVRICRDIVLPLVRADGGELHLVSLSEDEVALHLAGTCAGCPGVELTRRAVIEPALAAAAHGRKIVVTSGAILPKGAKKLSIDG